MIEIKTANLTYDQRNAAEHRRIKKLLTIFVSILFFIGTSTSYLVIRDMKAEEFICEIYHQNYMYGSTDLKNYYEFKEIMRTRNTRQKMVFRSIKPLKIEKWFTPDEINKFGLKVE